MFAPSAGKTPSDKESIRVLLVEDSPCDAQLAQRQLREADDIFDIACASTFKEAREIIQNTRIDAVLLDLGLPDLGGLYAVDTLNLYFPQLPVIVLSGQNDIVTMVRTLRHGAQEFLLKGECSGKMLRHAILSAIFRKSMEKRH